MTPFKKGIRARFAWERALIVCIYALMFSPTWSDAQEDEFQAIEVSMELSDASWFVNEPANAVIFVTSNNEPVARFADTYSDFQFYESEFVKLDNDERGDFGMAIEFVPLRTGIRAIPSIEIEIAGEIFKTAVREILVGEAKSTAAMTFSITANKKRAYVGEPIRLDFVWRCDLPMNQIRDLRLNPSFFGDSGLEVVIPRVSAPEEEQFGVPVAGRRAIARRSANEEGFPPNLGELRFSVFVRAKTTERIEISRTRLLCSRLLAENAQSNRYAAYFNNALFESADRSSAYEKLHAFSEAFAIEILPLPAKNREESFSGLFQFESIDISIAPNPVEVGQLMEIRIDVESEICSEMLSIPDLSRQSSLRHRFWVSSEINEVWRPDGRTFVVRARPFTTELNAFPSLAIQTFAPEEGAFVSTRTQPISMEVTPRDGMHYFPIQNIPDAQFSVVGNDEGIWQNYEASMMNDILNSVFQLLAEGMSIVVATGALLAIFGSLLAREWRKRAVDADYRRQRRAYSAFKRNLASGMEPAKALSLLVAGCFGCRESALTAKDAARLIRALNGQGHSQLEDEVREVMESRDLQPYAPSELEDSTRVEVAKVGERVFDYAKKGALLCVAFFVVDGSEYSHGSNWETVESLFAQALSADEAALESSGAESRFAEAALAFEACGEAGVRPGLSWFNAGNAWLKAGEIGRAIGNYRQAQLYRPFDSNIALGLETARALKLDTFASAESNNSLPTRWVKAGFSVSWILACTSVIFWIRYRNRAWQVALGLCALLALVSGSLVGYRWIYGTGEGVLIVDEAYGRKGPSYSYVSAFVDPLHNGLEVDLIERRSDWARVRLADGSHCWLPQEVLMILTP